MYEENRYDCAVRGENNVIFEEIFGRFGFFPTRARVVNIYIQRRIRLCTNFIEPLP
jgi:hypothetical protein